MIVGKSFDENPWERDAIVCDDCGAEMTEEMAAFIKKLTVDGLYAEATGDEIELFDQLFETMEA